MSPPADAPAEPVRPIIVKKVFVTEAGHHGGAWKVAYADFVTAMMAFFLMLWLLGATTENQRKGLADYFTPTLVKLKQESAGSDGMLGGSSMVDADSYPHRAGQTGNRELTIPKGAQGGPQKEDAAPDKDGKRHRDLKAKIEKRLEMTARLRRLARQVRVMRTPEGTRIDLVDDAEFSMFALGTTILVPEARELITAVAEVISDDAAQIVVRGHTDALPWKPGVVANNWSLSTGRAEATRQAMLATTIPETRFDRIEGVADRELLVKDDPADPRNRRISVLLLD
ncbi:flagellar motor protein MotB [Alteripontixanthobacter maritimus]|nr:flagellar motor protein MotB [Alteripontixanthobacter maritimus]